MELGWSADEAAYLYGTFFKGVPCTGKAFLRMEQGYLPDDPKRRMILAGMLGLAPTLLVGADVMKNVEKSIVFLPGVGKKKAIDVEEYQTALVSYWKQDYAGTALDALKDIARRIRTLHDQVLYTGSDQKMQMKRLIVGYHMRFSHIAREQGYFKNALEHIDDATVLAHEEQYLDLEAAAVHHRGAFFFDKGNLKAASHAFQTALSLKAPPQRRGSTLALAGFTGSRLSQTESDRAEALHQLDEAEKLAGSNAGEVSLTVGGYYLFRARTLMASPIKKLRSPDKALIMLDEMEKLNEPKAPRHAIYRQLESNIVQAQVYMDREYYPYATALAQDALDAMQELHSSLHLPDVASIYDNLKQSSYGKDAEVASLGVALNKVRYPAIFQ